MEKKPLPIGVSDFKKLIDGGYAYVDKTLFIQEILETGTEVVLIPRPRRFGKTLNLSMLRYFFEVADEDTSYLFKNLQIWQHPSSRALQGQFPVVFITFKDVKHSSWEKTLEHFRRLLAEEFQRHRYLLESSLLSAEEKQDYQAILRKEGGQTLCEESLRLLIKWMYLYHKKQVILLIDEYDAPVHSAYVGRFYEPLIEFLRNLLSGCLKDSSHLKRGVLTGILRIAKESIFSGLNNVKPFTLLNEAFGDKFGLLEAEVAQLLENYHLASKLPEIKQWYNGYRIGFSNGIYNPWSVLNCIEEKGRLASYWVNTSDNALMKQLIARGGEELKSGIAELLQGRALEKTIEEGIVFSDLDKSPAAVWSLLLFSGYLTVEAARPSAALLRLRIPNLEVGHLYQSLIRSWFETTIHLSNYQMLLNSLTQGDTSTFFHILQEFLLSSVSVFDVLPDEPEKIYHAFILGLLVGLKDRYEVKSNRESGYGRYDVMLIPKTPSDLGVVIEFKKIGRFEKTDLETAAASALKQIEERCYDQELLERGVQRILHLGLAFQGKHVFMRSKSTSK